MINQQFSFSVCLRNLYEKKLQIFVSLVVPSRYSEDSYVNIGTTAINWASTVREEQFYYKPNLNILQLVY